MSQERVISISPKAIFHIVLVLLALLFLWTIRDIVAVVFVALVFAAVMNPFVALLRKYRIPPVVSAILFYVLLFGAFSLAFVLVIPQVMEQASQLIVIFGDQFNVSVSLQDWIVVAQNILNDQVLRIDTISTLQERLPDLTKNAFSMMVMIFGGFVNFILVAVLAFYMVVEERQAMAWFKELVPEAHREFFEQMLLHVQRKFGSWLIGQFVLSLIIGILYYLTLLALNIHGALSLSLFAALAEFIPFVGPILAGTLVVIVALTQSPTTAIIAISIMLVIQQLESNVLIPKIMQKAVGLNPVISIIAFLVGAKIFGPVGMVLAIPVTAAASVAIVEYEKYRTKQMNPDT